MTDVNKDVEELITKEGYINGAKAKVAPFSYDSISYANETQKGIEGVSEYSYGNNQNIPIGDAKNLNINATTLAKGFRAQASSIPRQVMNHFFGRTSFNLNKIHEWFLRFLGYFQTHLRQDNNLWSPTAKYELGDVCFVHDTLVANDADKQIVRVFRCIKSVSGGLVNVRPIDTSTHKVNTEYWQESNVYDELYAVRFHGEATNITDGLVTTAKLATEAVTTAKLATEAVTDEKIATEAVTTAKLATGAVTDEKIATEAVTTAKLATRAVTDEKIATGAVTDEKIATGAVTASKCAGDVVKSVNGKTPTNGNVAIDLPSVSYPISISNGGTGVTSQEEINKAFVSALQSGDIAVTVTDGTEFVSSFASNNGFSELVAINVPYKRKCSSLWAYIKNKITSMKSWITNEMIAPGTITNSRLAHKTIQADSIADNAIKNNAIDDSSVTNSKIADFSITCGKLKKGSSYIMHYITIEWNNSSNESKDRGRVNFSLVSESIDYPTIESIAEEMYYPGLDKQIRLPCTGYVQYENPSKYASGVCSSVQSTSLGLRLELFNSTFNHTEYTIDKAQKVTIIDQALEIVAH